MWPYEKETFEEERNLLFGLSVFTGCWYPGYAMDGEEMIDINQDPRRVQKWEKETKSGYILELLKSERWHV